MMFLLCQKLLKFLSGAAVPLAESCCGQMMNIRHLYVGHFHKDPLFDDRTVKDA
jgi:hypothetical protein